jgi:hypothetical protein
MSQSRLRPENLHRMTSNRLVVFGSRPIVGNLEVTLGRQPMRWPETASMANRSLLVGWRLRIVVESLGRKTADALMGASRREPKVG